MFFNIIKKFNVRNSYKIVESDDFVEFVNKYTKEDYWAFFNKYLYDTRLPVLEYSFDKNLDDLIFTYRWTEVEEGFKMPFCIQTNEKKAVRLVGTKQEQEILLKNTSWFNFINQWKGTEGIEDHSFTYFWTNYTE